VEDYDTHVLAHPRECILDKEGYIFMALIAEEPVGTVALIKRGEGVYELSKMGVTLKYQGMRIGQKLMYQAINFAGAHNFSRLFLDSNTILEPAIWLYRAISGWSFGSEMYRADPNGVKMKCLNQLECR